MPSPRKRRVYPAVYRRMMQSNLPDAERTILNDCNKYRRKGMRDAFEAGWFMQRRGVSPDWSEVSKFLSPLALTVLMKGYEMRVEYCKVLGEDTT